jgi:hypothetical protein
MRGKSKYLESFPAFSMRSISASTRGSMRFAIIRKSGPMSSLPGGRLVELRPAVLLAFDRFLADGMSGHDLLYRIALSRMTDTAGA